MDDELKDFFREIDGSINQVDEVEKEKEKEKDCFEIPTIVTDPVIVPVSIKTPKRNKRKKPKCPPSTAVYVSGLPEIVCDNIDAVDAVDALTSSLAACMKRAGVLRTDDKTLQPKIKLYKKIDSNSGVETETTNGSALVMYVRPESVSLSVHYLDDSVMYLETPLKGTCRIKVEAATFTHKEGDGDGDRDGDADIAQSTTSTNTRAKRRFVARVLEQQQRGSGNAGYGGGQSKMSGRTLCTVVIPKCWELKHSRKYGENHLFYSIIRSRVLNLLKKKWKIKVKRLGVIPRHAGGIICVRCSTLEEAKTLVDYGTDLYSDIQKSVFPGKPVDTPLFRDEAEDANTLFAFVPGTEFSSGIIRTEPTAKSNKVLMPEDLLLMTASGEVELEAEVLEEHQQFVQRHNIHEEDNHTDEEDSYEAWLAGQESEESAPEVPDGSDGSDGPDGSDGSEDSEETCRLRKLSPIDEQVDGEGEGEGDVDVDADGDGDGT